MLPSWTARILGCLVLAAGLEDPLAARAQSTSRSPLPDVAANAPSAEPARAEGARALEALSVRSDALEDAGDFLGAAALREQWLTFAPGDVHAHWRIARDLVQHAESTSGLGDPERAAIYEEAHRFAERGRELDPDCGECCLYEFVSTARLAAVRGLARSLAAVREAGRLVEICLAHPPRWRDARGDEEADLYYGAAIYYRMLPAASWVAWAAGVRGDAARAVALARRAVELERDRADYRAELGAALLCDGARRDDPAALEDGRRVLREIAARGDAEPAALRARALLASEPRRACTNSAHGAVEWR